MCRVFAEFERSMIQERVKAGLLRARERGQRLGRPSIPDKTRKRVLKAKEKGLSLRKIAAEAGVSVGTVHNVIKAA